MAFINEYISPEDMQKYEIKEIDKNFVYGNATAEDWTIDKERNIYLRNVANGREELHGTSWWTFYWNEVLIELKMQRIDSGRNEDKTQGWSTWQINKMYIIRPDLYKDREARRRVIYSEGWLPEEKDFFEKYRTQILADLKEALIKYQAMGVFASDYKSYEITLIDEVQS